MFPNFPFFYYQCCYLLEASKKRGYETTHKSVRKIREAEYLKFSRRNILRNRIFLMNSSNKYRFSKQLIPVP